MYLRRYRRCCTHILQEDEKLLRIESSEVSQLYIALQELYCKIRSDEINDPNIAIRYIQSIAQTCIEIEQKQFGCKLETAIFDLVIFMTHGGVDTTNNIYRTSSSQKGMRTDENRE